MNSLNAYLALSASNSRRAVAKTKYRHIHLSDRPIVVIGYHLAGDVGAPLVLLWGTDPNERPQTAIVPEPRNRQLRFEALGTFGAAFVEYLGEFAETSSDGIHVNRNGVACAHAPQVIVPNRATAEWLFGTVGRFTRHLRTDSNPTMSPIVPRAGMYLSFFHDLLPGSSLVLPATEVLSGHWQTGQLASEDLNLSALLGWIAPTDGMDGVTAARAGEVLPPAGPLSDPNWDAQELADLIDRWHGANNDVARSAILGELDNEVRAQLDHTWKDCWQARRLIAALPEASSVAQRWERDTRAWARHNASMEDDTARFRNIPTPVQSARTLRVLERVTTDLKAEMALDDPLVMAAYITSSEALSARVVSVDVSRTIPGPRRRLNRPLVELEPSLPFSCPAGTVLFLATATEVEFEILTSTPDLVVAQVNRGAVSRRTHCRLPKSGEQIVLSPFRNSEYYPPPQYDEVPWTHRLPEPSEELLS